MARKQALGPFTWRHFLGIFLLLHPIIGSFSFWELDCPLENQGPSRVLAFAWLALRNKILTMDNIRPWNMVVVHACLLCLADEESVDHLLLHCRLTKALCPCIFIDFSCSWVLLQSLPKLFQQWFCPISRFKGKTIWRLSFLAFIWTIWKERNIRCFEGISTPPRRINP